MRLTAWRQVFTILIKKLLTNDYILKAHGCILFFFFWINNQRTRVVNIL